MTAAMRFGAHGRRLCARPGCGSPAAATLRFMPTEREAWLVDLEEGAPRTEGDLCARHASALVLPRGWKLHDERPRPADEIPKVKVEIVEVPKPEVAPVKVAPVEVAPVEVAPVEVARVEEPADEVERPRVPPQIGPVDASGDDELADVLDARTPLLRRAFRNALPE